MNGVASVLPLLFYSIFFADEYFIDDAILQIIHLRKSIC